MGLSIRAYARHRGVSHVAVKKAIDTGRITPLPDGTIDPVVADAQWAANTTPTRRSMADAASRAGDSSSCATVLRHGAQGCRAPGSPPSCAPWAPAMK